MSSKGGTWGGPGLFFTALPVITEPFFTPWLLGIGAGVEPLTAEGALRDLSGVSEGRGTEVRSMDGCREFIALLSLPVALEYLQISI